MIRFFFRSLIDYLFRRRSPGLYLIRSGFFLLISLLVGLSVGLEIPTSNGPLIFSWSSQGGTADLISNGIFILAGALVCVGLLMVWHDHRIEGRRRVLVIELRGLRDWQGDALAHAVPPSIPGRREQLLLDVRQGIEDGAITDPRVAVRRITSLPDDLARRTNAIDRSDVTYVLGGLAPVPLTFLTGVIFDDEAGAFFMDWDRHARIWRCLDEEDDNKRFSISGLNEIPQSARRVALAVSASYEVDLTSIASVEAGIPLVRLDLDGRSSASNWSETKQQALGRQFIDTAMALGARGAKEISLFLAAPASLVFRFGCLYDKRNLPSLLINQYEPSSPITYPWAIQMPVAGKETAEVILRAA